MLSDIKVKLDEHDLNALNRLNDIEKSLKRIISVSGDVPEPVRKEILAEVEAIKSNLTLTPKMRRLVSIVRDSGHISYADLASKLGISRSALRGLLSNTMKRSRDIHRYSVNGKGWVKYKHPKTTQIEDF
jgi:hypothetical protein